MKFYQDLSKYYEDIFPLTVHKLALIKKYIPLGASMLDVGCSTGEMAINLAKDGYQLSGVDLSEEMIAEARQRAKHEEVEIDFRVGDMRELGQVFAGNFAGISCFGNTIVHLTRLLEIRNFFNQIYNLLNSGGCFIFQIVNYDRIISQKITSLPVIDNHEKGVTFYRDYQYDQNTNLIYFNTRLVVKDGEESRHSIALYPLHSVEIKMLLTTVGFTKLALMGSFQGAEYDPNNSRPLIGVAFRD